MIAIVDSGVGNVGSIANMLKKVGAPAVVTMEASVIARAQKLILPGVGAFDNGMRHLAERGLIEPLSRRVLEDRTPILGLCLGMQLFTRGSEEGRLAGLGWLDGDTVRFRGNGLKVPHMGWNLLQVRQPHPLLSDLGPDPRFYFVHSYHVQCTDASAELARTTYGAPFTSAVARDNIMGVQFHPEKSHRFGLAVLRNFAERL